MNDINHESHDGAEEVKKKSHWKMKLILFLILILIGGAAYGYFWYTSLLDREQEADSFIASNAALKVAAEEHTVLLKQIADEKVRCEELISGGEGDFGSFEYCKRFIDWQKGVQGVNAAQPN